MSTTLRDYLRQVAETTARGDAREESYYSILKSMIEGCAGGKKTAVTVLPKSTDAGNPDFRVWDGKQHITGYIEAKTPGSNLDHIENSEQLKRYRDTFPNLVLTDFYEFRLYRDGQMAVKTFVARPFIAGTLKHMPPLENEGAFADLLSKFFSFSLPRTFTAENLARELAKRTRFLKDEIVAQELADEANGRGEIRGFYRAFEKYLLPGLDEIQFADLFSQTLTYGMFAARSRSGEDFTRESAYQRIPQTTGVLRDVFRFISLGDLPPQMEVIVDDIADVLATADLEKILHQFNRAGKGKDPIVHFYETFLSAYDPQLRNQRGVYYTPEPVVGYIVRSIHDLLKTRFNLPDGLADPRVTLLDPAAGTLTFPAEAMRLAVEEYTSKYGEGGKRGFVRSQLLKNFYAFELMMAPYAIGHLKMSYLLEELGCPLEEHDRFQLYLTNSLSLEDIYLADMPGLSALSEESHAALKVKQKPILVILGNPPYSGISANQSEWTERLLKTDLDGAQSYYTIDGQPLGERNPKWLQDDYVKFLRFAQWKVEKAGEGVVGMITNHGYLDNPTFRGMRQSLMKTFNEIHVLNLHGNSLKKEKTPAGGKDENVFDIRPGVAVVLLVKQKGKTGCIVSGGDLFGTREEKYAWLNEHGLHNSELKNMQTATPWYFFAANHFDTLSSYQEWKGLNEIFPKNNVGVVTGRDDFAIDYDSRELVNRINQLRNNTLSDEMIQRAYKINTSKTWNLNDTRIDLSRVSEIDNVVKPILYRPFDYRYVIYHSSILERMRIDVMRHMLQGENIGLISARSNKSKTMDHFFVTTLMSEAKCGERTTQSALFPLYLYPSTAQGELFGTSFSGREPNLMPGLLDQLSAAYGRQITPEEVLSYIYGVFYSNLYREKYAEALRIDFPRVPFTSNTTAFTQLAGLGKRLADLHLLKSAELNPPLARYQGSGSDQIEKAAYDAERGRVAINADKYFEGITPEVWHYQIGGYQVLMKYLKDRKGRRMDDPVRYIQIATALAKTVEIQKEIDKIYPEVEKACLTLRSFAGINSE